MSKARQIADLLADLDDVATSGAYGDLSGNPTNVSTFTNDSGYITSAALPTAVSDLTNDSNFQTDTQVSSTVSTAITNLIDTAPAALDTLNELAASINDDADFAGTMTTSLATKATNTDLTTLAGRVTTEEGNVDTLQTNVTALQARYRATQEITATAGQTAFAIASLTASPDDVEVFMNGIRLASSDYSGSYNSGTYTATLGEATVVNDIIEMVAWKI